MQINRRANMMLDQLIKGHVATKTSILPKNGSMLWVAALFTSLTAGYLSLQALSEPEPAHQWVADQSAVAAQPMEETLVLSSLAGEGVDIREEEPLDVFASAENGNSFELVMAELPEEVAVQDTELMSMDPEVTAMPVSGDWLDQSGWAVQVLATTDEAEAQRVAGHYDSAKVVHAERQNTEKYLVVVGAYDEIGDARAKSEELAEQSGSQPWVRSISQIRADVDKLNASG